MSDQNETAIVVNNNGPYRVMGDNIIIKDMAGNTFGLAGRTVVSHHAIRTIVVYYYCGFILIAHR